MKIQDLLSIKCDKCGKVEENHKTRGWLEVNSVEWIPQKKPFEHCSNKEENCLDLCLECNARFKKWLGKK